MILLILAVLASALGYVINGYTFIPKVLKFKPFTCKKCLSFWIGILMYIGYYNSYVYFTPVDILIGLGVGSVAFLLTILIDLKLW